MKLIQTVFKDVKIIEFKKYKDKRGIFYELYNKSIFEKLIAHKIDFIQDNLSISKKNVLRGLHFQSLKPQSKFIKVLKGRILDVFVDIRRDSNTYGEHKIYELSDLNNLGIWIPAGFAHGFLSLEEDTIINYKIDNYYDPINEYTLLWNDSNLSIDWGIKEPLLSKKDKDGLLFKHISELI